MLGKSVISIFFDFSTIATRIILEKSVIFTKNS